MTRDEIEKMEAGRELDALIEKCVFNREPELWKHYGMTSIQSYEYGGPPEYSTDISAAWELVSKMESEDYWWTFSNVVPNSDPIVYEFRFEKLGKSSYACEFTPELAICKAALLATMEES